MDIFYTCSQNNFIFKYTNKDCNQNSIFYTVSRLSAAQFESKYKRLRDFSHLTNVQSISGTEPASYSMDDGGSLTRSKPDHSPLTSTEVMKEAIHLCYSTCSQTVERQLLPVFAPTTNTTAGMC